VTNHNDFSTWTTAYIKEQNICPEWHYLLEHFDALDYRRPRHPQLMDIRKPNNEVGHFQRAVNITWAIKCCLIPNLTGIEFGSAGVPAPRCVNTDVRTGLKSHYPPTTPVSERATIGGDLRVDGGFFGESYLRYDELCGDTVEVMGTGAFPDGCFNLVLANHVLEHIEADPVDTLKEWSRLLIPGTGHIAIVVPEHRPPRLDVWKLDPDHKHAWTVEEFAQIAKSVPGLEVIEHATMLNHHSFHTVWRKL